MKTADSAFRTRGFRRKGHDLSRALRCSGVHFSTTLAQNQPEAFVGDDGTRALVASAGLGGKVKR